MDEVESFLQSMMETIAAAIASQRVCLVASAPRPSFALRSFFLDQTAAASLLQNPSTTTKYNTALLLSPGCCATSHHPAKATFAAFRLPTRLRFTLRRSWTLPAKASLSSAFPIIRLHCSSLATNTAAALSPTTHHRHLRRRHRVPSRALFTAPSAYYTSVFWPFACTLRHRLRLI